MLDTEGIKSLLETDIEGLYVELGRQILSSKHYALPISKKRYIQMAKTWLAQNRHQFKKRICNNERVQLFMNSKKFEDKVILISGIVDLISSICTGISPVTVAVLLVKEGLNSLCFEND